MIKIKEESIDLFEVVRAYNELAGTSFENITAKMEEKRNKRGGFERRLFLEDVKKR